MKTAYLQLRWEKEDKNSYLCYYELVLPLGEHDIRRENEDGEKVRDNLVVLISGPTRRTGGGIPCGDNMKAQRAFDTPYRDGAHAMWDSKVLGMLPIKVIAPDGIVIEEPSDFTLRKNNLTND